MKRRSRRQDDGMRLSGTYRAGDLAALLVLASLMLFVAACGGTTVGSGEEESGTSEETSAENEASPGEETSEVALAPADATVGEIPVVAVSATDRYVAVGEHHVFAFLSKPFDVETLLMVGAPASVCPSSCLAGGSR